MSDPSTDRAASVAKTLELDQQQTSLDRALKLQAEFERAKAAQRSLEERELRQEIKTAQKSHAPSPELELKPNDEIRRIVDRQIDEEKQKREHDRALAISEEYKARAEEQRQIELQQQLERSEREL